MPLLRPPLDRAVALWHAKHYDPTLDALIDQTGNGHHARLGSAVGADTNDPLQLVYDGFKFFYLPGTTGNHISLADVAALRLLGDADIRCRVAPATWTPGTFAHLVAKYGTTNNQRAYDFRLQADGTLAFFWSPDGSAALSFVTSTPVGFAAGVWKWLRFTFDADDGAGNRVGTFWVSDDDTDDHAAVSWTQLEQFTVAGTTSIFAGTAPLGIGVRLASEANHLQGKIRAAAVLDGINGTVVADVRAADATSPFASFVDRTGKTVTLNRSAFGHKLSVVDRTLFLLGTDDYFEVPDHPDLDFGAGDDFTLVVANRFYGTPPDFAALIAKRIGGGGNVGYVMDLRIGPPRQLGLVIDDGVTNRIELGLAPTAGQAFAAAGRRIAGTAIEAFVDGASDGATAASQGSLANALALRIFAESAGIKQHHAEFFGAALFREALSDV